MPTGWRPEDVKEKYPVKGIEDVYNFAKYRTEVSNAFIWYAIYQLLSCTALLLFMFFNFSSLAYDQLLLYGIFLFISVYGYSSLMDQEKYAKWIEFSGVYRA